MIRYFGNGWCPRGGVVGNPVREISAAEREAAEHLARQIKGLEKPAPHQGPYKRVLRLDI